MSYSKNPSALGMKLLACGRSAIDTSATNDLATYVDISPYEEVLLVLVSAKLGSEAITPETGTDLTMIALHGTASDGTGATAIKDRDNNNLSLALGGSAAAGRGTSMQIRTHGLKQFLSPAIIATGSTVTACYAVYGIGVRDTNETASHWTDEAGAVVANTAIA